jgi:hypothetical protein
MKLQNISHPQLNQVIQNYKLLKMKMQDLQWMIEHPKNLNLYIERHEVQPEDDEEYEPWMQSALVSMPIETKEIQGLRNQILNAMYMHYKSELDRMEKFIKNL